MTCIIGLKHKKKVYIGGDSCAVGGYETRVFSNKKVFYIGNNNNRMLIGYSGSFRMGQIIQYHVQPSEITLPIEKYLVRKFIPVLRKTLEKHKWLKQESGSDNINDDGQFLVGLKGQVFCIYEDFQVHSVSDNILTLGSGSSYALGAMLALADVPPKKRILTALEISGQLTTSVCAPYYVDTIG